IEQYKDIETQYRKILANKEIPLRVVHHDTKISNVLFDDKDEGLCVIDLDTVMPGYYFSDVGDMMRTYLSETTEEETDISKIQIRPEILKAIYDGYMEEMSSVLTDQEKELFYYSGKFMIYMQALRFLTDYLNDDCYYHTTYPQHNLDRARNQLVLLQRYIQALQTAIV
ncbi:MAG: aminoglycoside phosphotransferase family protein, partial [Pedobacter sp.]